MKRLSASAIALWVSLVPICTWGEAVVDDPEYVVNVPEFDCKYESQRQDGGGTKVATCRVISHYNTYTYNLPATTTPEQLKQEVYKRLHHVYNTGSINNRLKDNRTTITKLRTDLEAELLEVRTAVPRQIGAKVEEVVKTHLQDVLRDLLTTDPEFRKTVAGILKEK